MIEREDRDERKTECMSECYKLAGEEDNKKTKKLLK